MRRKCKAQILMVTMFLLTSPLLPWMSATSGDLSEGTPTIFHAPIGVQGSGGAILSTEPLPGSGTEEDPYIIEEVIIDVTQGAGIRIVDSHAHIVIKDVRIMGGTDLPSHSREEISNGTFHDQTYGIQVESSTNVSIHDNEVYDNICGIYVSGSNNITIFENLVHDNSDGILIRDSSVDNLVHNNTVYYNRNGIYIFWSSDRNDVLDNHVHNNTNAGVLVEWSSSENDISFNTIHDNNYGISIDGSLNTIGHNTIFLGQYGIHLDSSFTNMVHNNTVYLNDHGIFTSRSQDNNTIRDNTIFDNHFNGIFLYWDSDDNIVRSNDITDNGLNGICLEWDTSGNDIFDNTVNGHQTGSGIYLNWNSIENEIHGNEIMENTRGVLINWSSSDNKVHTNIIEDNTKGIMFTSSIDNMVYNNRFDNTENYNDSLPSGNVWNTTVSIQGNIVGGPYIGGNYWSNYTGNDTDGDGFGDTNLSYGPGDELPLVVLPVDLVEPQVSDGTTGTPTTGDPFTFSASAQDNRSITRVEVEHWFDGGAHITLPMTLMSGDTMDGDYGITMIVPSDAKKLDYILTASDFADNTATTSQTTLDVTDDDLPTITDLTGQPTTGDEFTMSFEMADNIEISQTTVEYGFDGGSSTTMALVDGSATVQVPSDALVMEYTATVTDTSDLSASVYGFRNVMDNDDPLITDLTGVPYTETDLEVRCAVSDNIGIATVGLEYDLGGGLTSVTMAEDGDQYYYNIFIPSYARNLTYYLEVIDLSGLAISMNRTVDVIDDVDPSIQVSYGQPTSGEDLYVTIQASDNWGVAGVSLEYWIDNGPHTKLDDTYSLIIQVPSDASVLNIMASVVDVSGNTATQEYEAEIRDNDRPVIFDLTGQPTTGDPFEIAADMTDNVGIASATLEYRFDSQSRNEVDFSGRYQLNVPEDVHTFHYTITCTDPYGNTAVTSNNLNVLDNDAPTIKDYTRGKYKVGRTLEFEATADDNIYVSSVIAVYWYDDPTDNQTLWLTNIGDSYVGEIDVPRKERSVHYHIIAYDAAGNRAFTDDDRARGVEIGSDNPMDAILIWLMVIIIIVVIVAVLAMVIRSEQRRAPPSMPGAGPGVGQGYQQYGAPYQGEAPSPQQQPPEPPPQQPSEQPPQQPSEQPPQQPGPTP